MNRKIIIIAIAFFLIGFFSNQILNYFISPKSYEDCVLKKANSNNLSIIEEACKKKYNITSNKTNLEDLNESDFQSTISKLFGLLNIMKIEMEKFDDNKK